MNYLPLAPSAQFEMVVNGAHLKYSFSGEFKRKYLQDNRKSFDYEYNADDCKKKMTSG
jgi:hypothetical protein